MSSGLTLDSEPSNPSTMISGLASLRVPMPRMRTDTFSLPGRAPDCSTLTPAEAPARACAVVEMGREAASRE